MKATVRWAESSNSSQNLRIELVASLGLPSSNSASPSSKSPTRPLVGSKHSDSSWASGDRRASMNG